MTMRSYLKYDEDFRQGAVALVAPAHPFLNRAPDVESGAGTFTTGLSTLRIPLSCACVEYQLHMIAPVPPRAPRVTLGGSSKCASRMYGPPKSPHPAG
jgi:hypothetical protein